MGTAKVRATGGEARGLVEPRGAQHCRHEGTGTAWSEACVTSRAGGETGSRWREGTRSSSNARVGCLLRTAAGRPRSWPPGSQEPLPRMLNVTLASGQAQQAGERAGG